MWTSVKLAAALCMALLCAPSISCAGTSRSIQAITESVRPAFVAAQERVRLNLPDLPDSPALRAYVIYDYLVAARLRRDLAQKPGDTMDTAIDAFLQARTGQPVARGLRHDWLVDLGRRRRWDLLLPRAADSTDPVLACDCLDGRLATGDTVGLDTAALARWNQPLKQPPECDRVFAWLKLQNLLTPALAETRVRAALAADNPRLAREFATGLTVAHEGELQQWSDLLEAPKSALTVLAAHSGWPVEPEALGAGFEKLAYSDSAAALNLLPALLARPDSTPELLARLQRAAALGAAYDRDPRAIAAFDNLPAGAPDTPVEEWRARAALWSGDYARVLKEIELITPNLAAQPRWRYWRARAVAVTQGNDAAAPLFAELAGLRDYYGYLAADRLHRGYSLNARPSADDARMQAAIAADPGLVRAHELYACDMTDEAAAEWTAVLGGADPAVKVQAAHVAATWGWFAQSVATLAQAGEWDDLRLRYPRPYPDAVAAASRLTGVPADWILAVMRQESLFRKDAVSRADARGLMQLQPATAAAVAGRWHLPRPGKDGLFEPSAAITLGAARLRELLDRNGGQLGVSLAAYNAGSQNLARWLPLQAQDADVWIENIPYGETRAYVQHVLEHIVAFAAARGAEPPRLEALLPDVAPAAPAGRPPSASTSADEPRGHIDRKPQDRSVEQK